MKCRKCGADLESGVLFCRECGSKVEPIAPQKLFCRECGRKLDGNAKFCSNCGANLSSIPEFIESDSVSQEDEAIEMNTSFADSTVEEPEIEVEEREAPKKTSKKEVSLGDKIKSYILSIWHNMDLFCKVITISAIFVAVLMLVSICAHEGLAIFFSALQIVGLIAAVLMHKNIIKLDKGWIKYIVLVVSILFSVLNIMSYSWDSDISDSNSSDHSWKQSEYTEAVAVIACPVGTSDCIGTEYSELERKLNSAGFTNITIEKIEDLKYGESDRIGTVEKVSIDGVTDFAAGQEFDSSADVVIQYHAYAKCKVNIHIDFIENMIFSKYDIKFGIGDNIESIPHGEEADFEYSLEPGEYTLTFTSKDSSSVKGETVLQVEGDVNASYKIFCHSDDINVETLYVENYGSVGENEIMIPSPVSEYKYMNYEESEKALRELGFTNISTKAVYDIVFGVTTEGSVESVSINGNTEFVRGDIFASDAEIVITYHMRQEDDPTIISLPQSLPDYVGESHIDVEEKFKALGFTNIEKKEVITRDDSYADGEVFNVTIEGNASFEEGNTVKNDQTILIEYYTMGEPEVIIMTAGSASFAGQKPWEARTQLENLGFRNIVVEEVITTDTQNQSGTVSTVLIEQNEFESGAEFLDNVAIVISVWKIPSPYEMAFVRYCQDYKIYYMFDTDTKKAVSFMTADTYVDEGTYSGDFSTGVTIRWQHGQWKDKFVVKGGGNNAILTDGNGFDWEYVSCDVDIAQSYLDELK